jgi:hypothetical protein
MRQDAVTLERFYASPLGRAVARVLSVKLTDLWGDAKGLSMLGLGYAIPALEAFGTGPGRRIAAVPFDHGPVSWSASDRGNASVAVGDPRLPFPDGFFDRVIVLHGLEETAPEGRIVLAAANRAGLWSRATQTPFGQGRPWTRNQLSNLLSGGLFQVTASSSTLYMPPLSSGLVTSAAEGWEVIGRMFMPGLGGVVLIEAVKRLYAPPGGGAAAPVTERIRLARPAQASRRGEH